MIPVCRTAGGHRRIRVADAVRFIRESGQVVVKPAPLGLPDVAAFQAAPTVGTTDGDDALRGFLTEGRGAEARGLVMSWYLAGRPPAEIFDGPVLVAMTAIGEFLRHDPSGVFLEHRATDLCVGAIHALKSSCPGSM